LKLKKTIDKSVDEANSSILNVITENRIISGQIEKSRDDIQNHLLTPPPDYRGQAFNIRLASDEVDKEI